MSRHTHIIGLGGAGMNPIATLLHECGEVVSGCDRASSAALVAAADQGITTFVGHSAAHLEGVDRLLVTSALPATHPELLAAQARAIPILTRHDIWREWSAARPTLAVTGTHGKTTTTAMAAVILDRAGRAPGFVIGARVPALGGNARWGQDVLVLEADEYARTFLALTPAIAVITNLDWDHVDIYPSQADYDAAFREFATGPSLSALVLCGDDPGLRRVCADLPAVWCGLGADNEWRASDIGVTSRGAQFTLLHRGVAVGHVQLGVFGEHNVRNALLALAACAALDVPIAAAIAGLADFTGSARRFELKGERDGVTVVDDYAHHPAEVRATLAAARQCFGDRRLVVYFQPHTFSRLQAFAADFRTAFVDADVVRIGQVYGARETAAADPTQTLVATMQHPDVQAVGDLTSAVAHLRSLLRPGDVLLTLGAGDGVRVGERILGATEEP